MNAKTAKLLRRKVRETAEDVAISATTSYKIVSKRVRFEGAQHTLLARDLSKKKIKQHDEKRDFRRAARAGVLPNHLLQELLGDINLVKPQVVLGACQKGLYKRTKRALS